MSQIIERFTARAAPSSFDPETGRFQAIVATNIALDRGSLVEVLDLDAIGSAGWPKSVPLQADHSPSVHQTVGDLSNFRMETIKNGLRALVADGELTKGPHVAAIEANLRAGKQRGFSIGLRVSKATEGKDPATGKRVRTVLAGTLVEGSLVVEGADPHSTVRSHEMPPENSPVPDNQDPPTLTRTALSPDQVETLGRAAGASEDVIRAVKDSDAPDADKFQMLLASATIKPILRSAGGHNETSLENPAALRSAAIEALDARNRGEEPKGLAAAVFADGEAGFGRRLLRTAGLDPRGMSDPMVLRNAAATSDYAIIAGGTFNLSMRREMEAIASPIEALFGRAIVSTFNPETSGLTDWTTLAVADKLENGEYKRAYVDESGETNQVHTIGGVTSISRELSINSGPRLGNMGKHFGRRLGADVADRQVAFLEQRAFAGKLMRDGKSVFDATRGNIESFAQTPATYIADLMGFRSDMARRRGAGGVMIGSYPTHWVVHPDYEETALRLLSTVQASSIADVNVLAGKLQVVVEPRLSSSAKSWLVVEPSKMDGAVRVFLQGNEAPFTESRVGFETDTIDFKIRHDFGLGWNEWRSWTRLDHAA